MSQTPGAHRRNHRTTKQSHAALLDSAAFYYLTKSAQSTHNHADYYFHHHDHDAAYCHGTIPSSSHHMMHQRSFLDAIAFFIKYGLYYSFGAFLLLSTSIAWYSLLYMVIMPSQCATESIFFNYNSSQESCNAIATAVIDLVSPNTQWKAHIPGVIQEDDGNDCSENSSKRILVPKKSYFIQVALTLPESTMNRDIGMFMVDMDLKSHNNNKYKHLQSWSSYSNNHLDFSTSNNNNNNNNDAANKTKIQQQQQQQQPFKLLASSSRPAMLPYQSAYVSLVKKSFLMIPLILGAVPEARTVLIECFDRFQESEQYPMNLVEIRLNLPYPTILANNNKNDNNAWKHVQIWKAELRIGKELNRLQWLMREWFYSFAFMGIAFIMGLQVLLWFSFKFAWHRKHTREERDETENNNNNNKFHHDNVDFDNLSGCSSFSIVTIETINDSDDGKHSKTNHGHASSTRKNRGHHVSSPSIHSHGVSSMISENEDSCTSSDALWEPYTSSTSCNAKDGIATKETKSKQSGYNENDKNYAKNDHDDDDQNMHSRLNLSNTKQDDSCCRSKSDCKKNNHNNNDNNDNNNIRQKNVGKKQKKKSNKKKKMKLSNDKSELKRNTMSKQQSKEDERIMAERVMKGDIEPFEIFTDLDEPE